MTQTDAAGLENRTAAEKNIKLTEAKHYHCELYSHYQTQKEQY